MKGRRRPGWKAGCVPLKVDGPLKSQVTPSQKTQRLLVRKGGPSGAAHLRSKLSQSTVNATKVPGPLPWAASTCRYQRAQDSMLSAQVALGAQQPPSQLKTYHVPPGHQAPQHLAPGKTRTAHRAAGAAPCGAPGVWSWGVVGAQGPGGSSPPLWPAWLGPGPAQHSLWLTPAAPHSRSLRAAAAGDCVVPFHPGLHQRCEYRSMLSAGTSALPPVSPACPCCPRAPFFYGTYLRGAAG